MWQRDPALQSDPARAISRWPGWNTITEFRERTNLSNLWRRNHRLPSLRRSSQGPRQEAWFQHLCLLQGCGLTKWRRNQLRQPPSIYEESRSLPKWRRDSGGDQTPRPRCWFLCELCWILRSYQAPGVFNHESLCSTFAGANQIATELPVLVKVWKVTVCKGGTRTVLHNSKPSGET